MEKSFKGLQSPKRIKMLIKMITLNNKQSYNFSDFERLSGFNTPQPDLRETLKYFVEINVLKLYEKILGVNYYKINKKNLKNFINDLSLTKLYIEYFEETGILYT